MYVVLLRLGSWKRSSFWHKVLSLKETLVVNKDALIMFRFQLAHELPGDYFQPAKGFVGHQELSLLIKKCSEHIALHTESPHPTVTTILSSLNLWLP